MYQSQNHEHFQTPLSKRFGRRNLLRTSFWVFCELPYTLSSTTKNLTRNWSSAILNCKVSSLGGWVLYRERSLNGSCLTPGWNSLSWPNKVAGSHPASAGLAPALASHIPESAGAGKILTSVWKPLTWDTITSWAVTVWQEVHFCPFLANRKTESPRISWF